MTGKLKYQPQYHPRKKGPGRIAVVGLPGKREAGKGRGFRGVTFAPARPLSRFKL